MQLFAFGFVYAVLYMTENRERKLIANMEKKTDGTFVYILHNKHTCACACDYDEPKRINEKNINCVSWQNGK